MKTLSPNLDLRHCIEIITERFCTDLFFKRHLHLFSICLHLFCQYFFNGVTSDCLLCVKDFLFKLKQGCLGRWISSVIKVIFCICLSVAQILCLSCNNWSQLHSLWRGLSENWKVVGVWSIVTSESLLVTPRNIQSSVLSKKARSKTFWEGREGGEARKSEWIFICTISYITRWGWPELN